MTRHRQGPRHAVTPPLPTRFRRARKAMARLALAVAALLALGVAPAGAVRAPDVLPGGEVAVPGVGAVRLTDAGERARLERGAPWREFTARHGGWAALWNARTASPHRAFGPAIPLPGFADEAGAVEAAVRAFIAAERATFGTPVLQTSRVQRVRDTWYVSFRQQVRGLPVLFSDWEFRVGANGNLIAFGADVHRVADADVPAVPRLPAPVARQAALAGLPFDPVRDRVRGGETLALLPVAGEAGLTYRTVAEARVETVAPPGDWRTLVDAATGELLWRSNHVRHAVGGTVTGTVHPLLPTDALAAQALRNLTVNVGPTPAVTDASGAYSHSPGGAVTVTAQLRGPWVDVTRQDGFPDASFSAPATDPQTVNIVFDSGNSHDAERDGFYHVNVVHDFVKALDAGATNIDYVAPCNVNISSNCNAFYSSSNGSVNFYVAGGGCPNMATMPDVVYHEYGHLVNHEVYQQAGQPFGMSSGTLHEGMADVLACLIQDTPDLGKGFFGPGTVLRDLDNTLRWPEDGAGDGHATGRIIGGAFWDLRESAGLAVARQLSHFAKYGLPDDLDPGIAMSEFFVETLVADDDDANLGNGTPHATEIILAFNAHGIGTGFFMDIAHAPLADQPGAGPYPVTATVAYTGPLGALAGSPTLHYSINGAAYQSAAMAATGNPSEYSAAIPGGTTGVVRYYVSATDSYATESTDPPYAPTEGFHTFLAGPATGIADLDMETDPGWTVGAAGDNATSGLWLRADPVGTEVTAGFYVQPEDDHTVPGAQCWVTGNAAAGAGAGTNDVDGGRTTLTSATYDATPAGLVDPVISYWRWYSNNQGASPGLDLWRVDISNDGGTNWVSVESTPQSAASWRRNLFRIADFVAPTASMRLRFIAEDAGDGSLVEAAVDDVELLAFPQVVGVGDSPAPARLALALASSHPTAGALRLRYALPAAGAASLALYDVTGRAVRTLVAGMREAGDHVAEWDGRDDTGAALPSGTYFARLTAGPLTVSRTLIRTR